MKYYIYRINDKKNELEFYIGSTNNMSSRKSHHKKNVHNKVGKMYWGKLYQYIRANGRWDNFEIIILETGEIESKDLIRKKEQEYITLLKPTLNSISAHK